MKFSLYFTNRRFEDKIVLPALWANQLGRAAARFEGGHVFLTIYTICRIWYVSDHPDQNQAILAGFTEPRIFYAPENIFPGA